MTDVFGIKLIWKLMNKEGLWTKYMHENYIKNQSFWDLEIRSEFSVIWKNILKLRPEAL